MNSVLDLEDRLVACEKYREAFAEYSRKREAVWEAYRAKRRAWPSLAQDVWQECLRGDSDDWAATYEKVNAIPLPETDLLLRDNGSIQRCAISKVPLWKHDEYIEDHCAGLFGEVYLRSALGLAPRRPKQSQMPAGELEFLSA